MTFNRYWASLEQQHSMKIEKKKFLMEESFKMVGERHVKIKLHPKVTAELKVKITEA